MKKLLFFLITGAFSFTICHAQNVTLKGDLNFSDPIHKVYLTYRNGDDRVSDSAVLENGRFTFTEKINEPTLASLMLRFEPKKDAKQLRMDRMQIFLEPGIIHIKAKDSLKAAVVTGSKAQKEYEAYNKLLKPYQKQESTMGPRYEKFRAAKDEAGMKSIQDEYQAMLKEKNEKVVQPYILAHTASPIILTILNQYIGYDIDPATAEPLYNQLSDANKNTYSGKSLKERIETAKKTAVGAMAMNFTQNDTLDKPVSLSDFKGKYVLVDFWASWCGPCRAENPNVVKAFNEYKDKNFTVLGVSLDQPGKKEAWLSAIHHDILTWTQVSDLKFWDNEVAKLYGIRAIPQNFLIDPSGKIIAKNIRGEELNKKLQEVLE